MLGGMIRLESTIYWQPNRVYSVNDYAFRFSVFLFKYGLHTVKLAFNRRCAKFTRFYEVGLARVVPKEFPQSIRGFRRKSEGNGL